MAMFLTADDAADDGAAIPNPNYQAAADSATESPASQVTMGAESAANEAAAEILAADAQQDGQHSTADASAAQVPPVILILCGVPGSGKSTFSAQLMAKGHTSWVRVNQDSINKGRSAVL